MSLALIDYGMGNVRSILNALEYLGAEGTLTSSPDEIAASDRIILPGVGAFGDAMNQLRANRLDEVLHREVIQKKKPFLGICLGLQILANSSTEHGTNKGLGWIDAEVDRFDSAPGLKIPHMGWNNLTLRRDHPLFDKLSSDQRTFYFVHSFYIRCANPEDVLGTCDHGGIFTAAIARENIVATQFHPEKSQDSGLQLLENFLNWKP